MRVVTVEYKHPGIVEMESRGMAVGADWENNVGRRCDAVRSNEKRSRAWEVKHALREPDGISGNGFYMLYNVHSGEWIIRHYSTMTNLF